VIEDIGPEVKNKVNKKFIERIAKYHDGWDLMKGAKP
jgi:hypothetical protein